MFIILFQCEIMCAGGFYMIEETLRNASNIIEVKNEKICIKKTASIEEMRIAALLSYLCLEQDLFPTKENINLIVSDIASKPEYKEYAITCMKQRLNNIEN